MSLRSSGLRSIRLPAFAVVVIGGIVGGIVGGKVGDAAKDVAGVMAGVVDGVVFVVVAGVVVGSCGGHCCLFDYLHGVYETVLVLRFSRFVDAVEIIKETAVPATTSTTTPATT